MWGCAITILPLDVSPSFDFERRGPWHSILALSCGNVAQNKSRASGTRLFQIIVYIYGTVVRLEVSFSAMWFVRRVPW